MDADLLKIEAWCKNVLKATIKPFFFSKKACIIIIPETNPHKLWFLKKKPFKKDANCYGQFLEIQTIHEFGNICHSFKTKYFFESKQ